MKFLTILFLLSFNLNVFAQLFTKVIEGDIVNDGGFSRGASWIDYDGDGDLDLYVCNGKDQINFFYENNGDNTFSRIENKNFLNGMKNSQTATWGDYDNDGLIDLFVANNTGHNDLYKNMGGGEFTEVVTGLIETEDARTVAASWGDYDNDGYLDLFCANGFTDAKNFLYHNNGDGSFTKITSGDIVNDVDNSQCCIWADYDNDNDQDLFVTNAKYQNDKFYRNNGDGSFESITDGVLDNDGSNSIGASWGDYNYDGYFDLFLCGIQRSFYHNNGDGTFSLLNMGELSSGRLNETHSSFIDYDNDGCLDVFITRGTNETSYYNFLYHNTGDEMFLRVYDDDLVSDSTASITSTWADINRDGFLDVFVSNIDNQNNLLYLNNGNNNSWINISCEGTISNRSAIGAKVKIKAIINEQSIWQMRQISAQDGFQSQHSLSAEFGLGDASVIDSVVIMWPSGIIQTLTDVDVNQFLTIKETYLKADFSADTTYGEPPLQVSFTDLSTTNDVSDINSWKWDFDNDGTYDSEVQNPQWNYEQGGSYSVKLFVSNGVFSDSLIREDYIRIISVAESPTILDIRDVPNDQGGWVYVEFIRSIYDTDSLKNQKVTLNSTEFYTIEINEGSEWIAANTTVAYGKYKYSILVPTPIDSTLNSDGMLHFRIIAAMDEGNYVSDVVEGYSLDNIAPSAPMGVAAYFYEGEKIKLSWDQSPDNDLNFYRIYRGIESQQMVSTPYAETAETSYLDSQIEPGKTYYYRLTSVDISGNESDFSEAVSVPITSREKVSYTAKEFRLEQNYPNPFNPSTKIKFMLPKGDQVMFIVYNTLGEVVATLVNRYLPAGFHQVEFDAHNLSSGVYLYRIHAGRYSDAKKMILIK